MAIFIVFANNFWFSLKINDTTERTTHDFDILRSSSSQSHRYSPFVGENINSGELKGGRSTFNNEHVTSSTILGVLCGELISELWAPQYAVETPLLTYLS